MRSLVVVFIFLSLFDISNAYATESKTKDWSVNIIPFFWAVGIDGNIEVGVPEEGVENQLLHISENFNGILKHIHSGGMLDVNVNKGRFGVFLNSMYASVKNLEVTTSDGFEVQVNTEFALFSAGALYRVYERDFNRYGNVTLAPYAGARYTKNNSNASLTDAPEFGASYSTHWTDPIIGAILQYKFNKYWSVDLAADFSVKKHQDSYNLIGLIGYKPFDHLTAYLGYRQLYQSFTEGSGPTFFEWKMHIYGPIIGLAFGF